MVLCFCCVVAAASAACPSDHFTFRWFYYLISNVAIIASGFVVYRLARGIDVQQACGQWSYSGLQCGI